MGSRFPGFAARHQACRHPCRLCGEGVDGQRRKEFFNEPFTARSLFGWFGPGRCRERVLSDRQPTVPPPDRPWRQRCVGSGVQSCLRDARPRSRHWNGIEDQPHAGGSRGRIVTTYDVFEITAEVSVTKRFRQPLDLRCHRANDRHGVRVALDDKLGAAHTRASTDGKSRAASASEIRTTSLLMLQAYRLGPDIFLPRCGRLGV